MQKIYINGEEQESTFSIGNNEMLNLGNREIGEKIKLEIVPEEAVSIKSIYVYYENEQNLLKHYEKLKQTQVYFQRVNDKYYKGYVDIQEDNEYIIFTIPYDEGWKIEIDGKEIIYDNILNSLIGINVDKGTHNINLKYTPPGIKAGTILSFIGVIVLLISARIEKKEQKKT